MYEAHVVEVAIGSEGQGGRAMLSSPQPYPLWNWATGNPIGNPSPSTQFGAAASPLHVQGVGHQHTSA